MIPMKSTLLDSRLSSICVVLPLVCSLIGCVTSSSSIPPIISPQNVDGLTPFLRWVGPAYNATWSPDSQMIAFVSQDALYVLDVQNFRIKSRIPDVESGEITFREDGQVISVAGAVAVLRFWDLATEKQLLTYEGNATRYVVFLPRRKDVLLAETYPFLYYTVLSWFDPKNLMRQEIADVKGAYLKGLSSSYDGRLLALSVKMRLSPSRYEHLVSVWDIEAKEPICHIPDNAWAIFAQKDNMLAVSNFDGVISLWNVVDCQLIKQFHGSPSGYYNNYSINPDGSLIAFVADDSILRIVDVSTEDVVSELRFEYPYLQAKFSPDGRFLLVYNYGESRNQDTLTVWQVSDNAVLHVISPSDFLTPESLPTP